MRMNETNFRAPQKGDEWVLCDLSYAVACVVVNAGDVVDAAPIMRKWAVGLSMDQFRKRGIRIIEDYPPLDKAG